MELEKCSNCERVIGKLEQACVYKSQVVCPECHIRLANPPSTEVMVRSQNPIQHVQRVEQPTQVYVPIPIVQPPRVQTIEKTGKKWKLLQLISFLMIMIGLVAPYIYQSGTNGRNLILLLPVGIILFIIARVFAWWYHG